jgi:hypothetical protein
LISSACNKSETNNSKLYTHTPDNYPEFTLFTGNSCKGNYIWTGAMNLAWNETIKSFTKGDADNANLDSALQMTFSELKNTVIDSMDMIAQDYYYQSGLGQKTVEIINTDVKRLFPKKPFLELKKQAVENELIVYSYYLKKNQHVLPFKKCNMLFNNIPVDGFTQSDWFTNSDISLVDYQNKDHFMVRIDINNRTESLFLAKGYRMDQPTEVLDIVKDIYLSDNNILYRADPMQNHSEVLESIKDEPFFKGKRIILLEEIGPLDTLQVPSIVLACQRSYHELTGQKFMATSGKDLVINQALESICFDLDESFEQEIIKGTRWAFDPVWAKMITRNFIFDKPFWIVLKKRDRVNPTFIMGVTNTAFMNVLQKKSKRKYK